MKNSINEFYQKIKVLVASSKEEIVVSLIIIFVGLASFGLGKLSVLEELDKKVDIELKDNIDNLSSVKQNNIKNSVGNVDSKSVDNLASVEVTGSQLEEVVASKSGKKYHYPWCSGAKQIAEKNKITFDSIEDARKAGYTPASNCKGLK